MRPITLAVAATLAAVFAHPADAGAQDISSPFRFIDERHELQLFAGYTWADGGTAEMASDAGSLYGGRYAFRVGGPFALIAEMAYFPSTRTVMDLTDEEEPVRVTVGEADFNLLLGNVGVRFDFTGPRSYHRLVPYLLALAGGAFELSDAPAVEDGIAAENRLDFGTAFAGAFALGTEIDFGSRVGLWVEARQALWKFETPEPFVLADPDLPQDEWTGNPTVLAGVSVRF